MFRFGIKLFTRFQSSKIIVPKYPFQASRIFQRPFSLVCSENSRFSDDSQSGSRFRRYFDKKILFCGTFLTLFGFEEKLSDEDELILTIKRSVLLYNREEYNKVS